MNSDGRRGRVVSLNVAAVCFVVRQIAYPSLRLTSTTLTHSRNLYSARKS